MALYLLDSGIIIDVLNGRQGRQEAIAELIRGGSELACCSINVTEVYAGLRPGEETRTERLLRTLRFFEVTWEIAKKAGDLKSHWRQRGRTLALPDVTIAAVALTHELPLLTGNPKYFPMSGLRLVPLLEPGLH